MFARLIILMLFITTISLAIETFSFTNGWYPTTYTAAVLPKPNAQATVIVSPIDPKQMDCLRQNIYFEARNQNVIGQVMVGLVTMNRTKIKGFRNNICDVVYENGQFSWTASKHHLNLKNSGEYRAWQIAGLVAYSLMSTDDLYIDKYYPYLAYYHTTKVKPKWAKVMHKEFVLGDHVFYTAKL